MACCVNHAGPGLTAADEELPDIKGAPLTGVANLLKGGNPIKVCTQNKDSHWCVFEIAAA